MSSPVDVGTLVATITADDSELVRVFARAQSSIDAFGGTTAQAQLSADSGALEQGVAGALSAVQAVDGASATAQLQGDASNALGAADEVGSALSALNGSSATVQLQGDASQAEAAVQQAESAGKGLSGQEFTAQIGGDIGDLLGMIQKGRDALDKGLGAAAGLAIGAALGGGIASAINMEPARKRIAAQLRLTPQEQASVNDAASNLFANNWSEDIGGANEVIANTISAFKDLRNASSEELAAIGTKAAAVADLTGVELGKVTRTAGQLVKNGMAKDATEAFDLLTAASQSTTTEMQDDLFEVTSEYNRQFSQLGISGSQALKLISDASGEGAIGMDKVGDALLEATVLMTDMSTSSQDAYKTLGLNAQEMSNAVLAGGETAQAGLQKIVGGLLDIEDPATQANTAIALFGTPIEDLGTARIPAFLEQLAGMDKGLGDVTGRADEAADMLGTTAAGSLAAFWNQLQLTAETIGTGLLPVLAPLLATVGFLADGVGTLISAFTSFDNPILTVTAGLTALAILGPKIVTFLRTLPALALKAGASLSAALGPLGLVLAGITAAIVLFSGDNADAAARVQEHADAVANLRSQIDGATGLFKADAVGAFAEKFAAASGTFDQVGVSVGQASAMIVQGAEDGGKSWQGLRDLVAQGLPMDQILADNSTVQADIEAMALATGKSQEEVVLAIAAGGQKGAELVQAMVAALGGEAEGYQESINNVRGSLEETYPVIATVRTETEAAAEAQRQATEAAKGSTEATAAAAKAKEDQALAERDAAAGSYEARAALEQGTTATAAYADAQRAGTFDAEAYGKAIQAAAGEHDTEAEAAQRAADVKTRLAGEQERANQAYTDAQAAADAAGEAMSSFEEASQDSADAQSELADQADRVSDALDRQSGRAISLEEANAKAAQTGDDLAEAFKQGEEGALRLSDAMIQSDGSINTSDETGRKFRAGVLDTREAMVDQATAAFEAAGGYGNLTAATAAAEAASKTTYDQFLTTATGAGLTQKAAEDLAKEYGLLPSDVSTAIRADDLASQKVAAAKAAADAYAAKQYEATLSLNTSGLDGQIAAAKLKMTQLGRVTTSVSGPSQLLAGGGSVVGPGTGTSDDIPALLSNGEHVWTAEEVAKLGGQNEVYRLRAAVMAGNLPKYAGGGGVGVDLAALSGNLGRSRGPQESAVAGALADLAAAVKDLGEKSLQAAEKAAAERSDWRSAVDAFRKTRQAGAENVAAARADRAKDVREATIDRNEAKSGGKADVAKVAADQAEKVAAAEKKKRDAEALTTKTGADRVKRAQAIAAAEAALEKARAEQTKANSAAQKKAAQENAKAEQALARARSQGNEAVRRATAEANRNNAAAKAKSDAERRQYVAQDRAAKAAKDRAVEAERDMVRTQKARGLLVTLGRQADQAATAMGAAREKLDRVKADRAALAESVAGGFTQGGLSGLNDRKLSGKDVAQAFKSKLSNARAFADDLKALKGKLSPDLYRQLAEMGVEGGANLADTLAKSDPATLRSINASNAATVKVGKAAGASVAGEIYGKEQQKATAELRQANGHYRDIKRIMGGLSRGIGIELAGRLSGRSRDDFLKWLADGQKEAGRR